MTKKHDIDMEASTSSSTADAEEYSTSSSSQQQQQPQEEPQQEEEPPPQPQPQRQVQPKPPPQLHDEDENSTESSPQPQPQQLGTKVAAAAAAAAAGGSSGMNKARRLLVGAVAGAVVLTAVIVLVAVLVPRAIQQQRSSVEGKAPESSHPPPAPASTNNDANATASTPSASPTVKMTAQTTMPTPSQEKTPEEPSNPACMICREGEVISSPEKTVQDPFNFDRIACSEMERRGRNYFMYDTIQCSLVKTSVAGICGCEQAPPTSQPTSAATEEATAVPTAAQSVEATEQPTTGGAPTTESPTTPESDLSYFPGLLTVRENGLILSQGLKSRVLAKAGRRVDYADGGKSQISVHSKPDFGGVFEDPRPDNVGGWIYLSNSEIRSRGEGGVGAFTINKDGDVIDYSMVLEGTKSNCGGGRTPWGAWISCEEHDTGRNWQVDPTGERQAGVITLGNDGGRFESFAYGLSGKDSPQFFVTEDKDNGAMQRFRPDNPNWDDPWNILYGSGKTDFLVLQPDTGKFIFTSDRDAAKKNADQYYRGSEGIDSVGGILYFVSKMQKTLFILNLHDNTYTSHSTEKGAFDAQPDQVVRVLGSDSLLFFTEDGRDRPGIHSRDKYGAFFTILEGLDRDSDESTGLGFSPDGKHMYFAMQDAGVIFDVTRRDGLPFHAKSLNIKYHAVGYEPI